jgi:hypothetical protein
MRGGLEFINLRSSGFDLKQGSEIASRRRGGRRVNEFLIKKHSDLCELCGREKKSPLALRRAQDERLST